MSEFQIKVVQLGDIKKHENADSLSITMVHGGYPCIIHTGDFHEGDLAVYVPVDALVSLDNPKFAFLRKEGEDRAAHRVKAMRLRGVFSMGLLIPADPSWQAGQDVQTELGIKKYEPPEELQMGGENEHCPFDFPVYTDIEGLRKCGDVLQEGERVCITEKIDGSNFRAVWWENRLWVGSHKTIKKEDDKNLYWKSAKQFDLANKLKHHPGIILYGEIYGWVQKLRYGFSQGKTSLLFFDAMDLKARRFFDVEDFGRFIAMIGLPYAPIEYYGPWHVNHICMAESSSHLLSTPHIKEGIVIKPMIERFDSRIGRVILKYHGEGYLTRKGG